MDDILVTGLFDANRRHHDARAFRRCFDTCFFNINCHPRSRKLIALFVSRYNSRRPSLNATQRRRDAQHSLKCTLAYLNLQVIIQSLLSVTVVRRRRCSRLCFGGGSSSPTSIPKSDQPRPRNTSFRINYSGQLPSRPGCALRLYRRHHHLTLSL
jgi:hypothetical protein